MNRNLFWKFFFVVFIVAWAAWSIYPPQPRNLIEVFEETAVTRLNTNDVGTVRAITTEARRLEQENPNRTFANLRQAIGTNEITHLFPAMKVVGEKDPARAVLQRLQQQSAGKIKLGLDLQGGTSFLVRVKPRTESTTNDVAAVEGEKQRVLEQAVEVLRRRVDKFGVAEPEIRLEGEDQIRGQLPGLSEADKEAAKGASASAAISGVAALFGAASGLGGGPDLSNVNPDSSAKIRCLDLLNRSGLGLIRSPNRRLWRTKADYSTGLNLNCGLAAQ